MFGDDSIVAKLEDIKMSDFGEVGEIVITKDDTLLMKGQILPHFELYNLTKYHTLIIYYHSCFLTA